MSLLPTHLPLPLNGVRGQGLKKLTMPDLLNHSYMLPYSYFPHLSLALKSVDNAASLNATQKTMKCSKFDRQNIKRLLNVAGKHKTNISNNAVLKYL